MNRPLVDAATKLKFKLNGSDSLIFQCNSQKCTVVESDFSQASRSWPRIFTILSSNPSGSINQRGCFSEGEFKTHCFSTPRYATTTQRKSKLHGRKFQNVAIRHSPRKKSVCCVLTIFAPCLVSRNKTLLSSRRHLIASFTLQIQS